MTWKQFWGICEHDWNIIDTVTVKGAYGGIWYKFILQCERCGAIKSKRV